MGWPIVGDTLEDDVVTILHRDTLQQEKVEAAEIESGSRQAIRGWKRPAKQLATG